MDFLSYNLNRYKTEISTYEAAFRNGSITQAEIDEAKIYHKFLEDLKDEEYSSTYARFQSELNATRRLEDLIRACGDEPFCYEKKPFQYGELHYLTEEFELNAYLDRIFKTAPTHRKITPALQKQFGEILNFSKWIRDSVKPDTAVIFLLRDTLLPYLAFKIWNNDDSVSAVPLPIGRKYLSLIGNENQLYNCLSDGVYTALGEPDHFWERAVTYIKDHIDSAVLNKTGEVLSSIRQHRICVVETGVHGTMPLLLKSCDERVADIRLYTTVPWLYNAWDGCFYSKKYEHLRLFETLKCHDLLFSLSSVRDQSFYIREINDSAIREDSLSEIACWTEFIKCRNA